MGWFKIVKWSKPLGNLMVLSFDLCGLSGVRKLNSLLSCRMTSSQNARIVWWMCLRNTAAVQGAIAKWLRRQIRNLFLFEGAGSNPAGVERHLFTFLVFSSTPLNWTRFTRSHCTRSSDNLPCSMVRVGPRSHVTWAEYCWYSTGS